MPTAKKKQSALQNSKVQPCFHAGHHFNFFIQRKTSPNRDVFLYDINILLFALRTLCSPYPFREFCQVTSSFCHPVILPSNHKQLPDTLFNSSSFLLDWPCVLMDRRFIPSKRGKHTHNRLSFHKSVLSQ